MKEFLLNALITLVKVYVSSGVFDRVSQLVEDLILQDIPGVEKRELVLNAVRDEFGHLWGSLTSVVVDLIIAVTRLKSEKPTE